jgi:hypothetical protein
VNSVMAQIPQSLRDQRGQRIVNEEFQEERPTIGNSRSRTASAA